MASHSLNHKLKSPHVHDQIGLGPFNLIHLYIAASYVEFYAEEIRRIRGGIYSTPLGNGQIINKPEPVGVCALITPWNFPSSMLTRKAAPALAAGCSIIAKPDSQTPFSAIALANLAIEAGIPDSVFNLVTCRSENTSNIGELLATHPLIAKLSFTGSTRVGRLLMSQASHTLKRLSMELGGHAPFLVLDDADVEEAAAGIVKSRFRNAGQTCICANRIIIHRSVYEKVVSCLLEIISKMKIGSGFQKDVSLGPMINSEARSKLLERLNHAIMHEGARVIYGGETVQPEESKGAFMQPTLVENVSNESSLLKEELFGPVAVLIPVESDEEAISIANSSDYGLASYIYTKDSGRALRIADRLESGMVGINEVVISMADAPFGGVKQSGFGREGGHQGLMEYLHTKYINLKY